MKRNKPKLSAKQKKTIKKMKEVRQIDSQNLREIIINKKKWTEQEKLKGLKQIANINIQINRLDGIILFCKDLIQPIDEVK